MFVITSAPVKKFSTLQNVFSLNVFSFKVEVEKNGQRISAKKCCQPVLNTPPFSQTQRYHGEKLADTHSFVRLCIFLSFVFFNLFNC